MLALLNRLRLRDNLTVWVHHGDCKGADADAHALIRRNFPTFRMYIHPPEQLNYRAFCVLEPGDKCAMPLPYLDRNMDIAKWCTFLIAFPKTATEELRSGTWSTIRYTEGFGKPVFLFPAVEEIKPL